MRTKEKIELVKKATKVFVAYDGKEFERKIDCLEYEREQKLKSVEHLKIRELEDVPPINCEEVRDDYTYTWYKVNNKEEFDLLNDCYDGSLSQVNSYPEIICVEEDYDGYTWNYYLSDMFKHTEQFWKDLGYTVSFESLKENA